MTPAQRNALVTRADLLEAECKAKRLHGVTWAGRLAQLGEYGRFGGGSSTDRRLVVEAMVALERQG